jgi:hypothetical protein
MSIGDINKEFKRISGLTQNKNLDESFLRKQAQLNVWKRQINISSRFGNKEQATYADKLYSDYIDSYEIESFSDMNTLADLVFEEVLKKTLQSQIDQMANDTKLDFISDKIIKGLHETETRVLELKQRIGIDKGDKEKVTELSALESLKKRFAKYISFHKNEYTMVCPECGIPTLLRRKTKDFEVLKHPFFSGRFWYNARGIALVKKGVWTREEYAYVFFTAPEYVDWCIKHESELPEIPNVSKTELEEFISKNPYIKKAKIPNNILEQNK